MMTLNDVKLSFNFNLRRPCDTRRTTPIYCVVRLDHRQMKLPTALKVYPHHWDDRKQECVVSADMSEAERNDNMQANRVIFALRCKIDEIISYLCSGGVVVDADFMERYIKSKLTIPKDMANKNAVPPIRRITATTLLNKAFDIAYTNKQTLTASTISQNRSRLDGFLSYIEVTGKYDTPDLLTQKGINDYKRWLVKMSFSGDESMEKSSKHINQLCQLIVRLINKELCESGDFQDLKLTQVVYTKIPDPRVPEEMKRRAISSDEVERIMSCPELSDVEKEYRDIFSMQLATGVRFSDLSKLFTHDYIEKEKDGELTYIIKTHKEKILAVIIVTDDILELQRRYESGFSFKTIRENAYNNALKSIFLKAGLTQTESYCKDIAGTKVERTGRLCDIISNHYARHTFITNKLREGYLPNKLCDMTGHADDEMIKRVYGHLTADDKVCSVVAEHKRVAGQTSPQATTANPLDVEAIRRLAVQEHEATEQLNAERQRIASLEQRDRQRTTNFQQMLTIEEQRREIVERNRQRENTAWESGITPEDYRKTMVELDEQGDEAEIDI